MRGNNVGGEIVTVLPFLIEVDDVLPVSGAESEPLSLCKTFVRLRLIDRRLLLICLTRSVMIYDHYAVVNVNPSVVPGSLHTRGCEAHGSEWRIGRGATSDRSHVDLESRRVRCGRRSGMHKLLGLITLVYCKDGYSITRRSWVPLTKMGEGGDASASLAVLIRGRSGVIQHGM